MERNFTFKPSHKAVFFIINTCFVLFAVLFVIELFLRIIYSQPWYYLYPPNTTSVYKIKSSLANNKSETEVRFTVNSLGLRGPELPFWPKGYILLFVGGSTTECRNLDDNDAWPYLVMKDLGHYPGRYPVFSQNAGKSGYNTRHHLIFLEHFLAQMKADCVIVLSGGNEFNLINRGRYNPDFLLDQENKEEILLKTFWNINRPLSPGDLQDNKLFIWRLIEKIKMLYAGPRVRFEDWTGEESKRTRAKRQKAEKVAILKDKRYLKRIDYGILEYKRNVKEMINICRQYKVRLIFMTQPTLWREGLSEDLKKRLWMGYATDMDSGTKFYIKQEDLARVMNRYNTALIETCRENNIEYIDLANIINKDVENFYDDGHFTLKGSRRIGRIVADYLRVNLP